MWISPKISKKCMLLAGVKRLAIATSPAGNLAAIARKPLLTPLKQERKF
jgi:hypothetical protein